MPAAAEVAAGSAPACSCRHRADRSTERDDHPPLRPPEPASPFPVRGSVRTPHRRRAVRRGLVLRARRCMRRSAVCAASRARKAMQTQAGAMPRRAQPVWCSQSGALLPGAKCSPRPRDRGPAPPRPRLRAERRRGQRHVREARSQWAERRARIGGFRRAPVPRGRRSRPNPRRRFDPMPSARQARPPGRTPRPPWGDPPVRGSP